MDNKSVLDVLNEQFNMKDIKPGEYSPLSLAFIGDSVFDLIVKTVVVERGNCQANKLHLKTSKIVKAQSQAMIIKYLQDNELLTSEEQMIYRRGHNAKSYTKAKNASYSEYSKATGFECLIGYLYLSNRMDRAIEIAQIGVDYIEKQGNLSSRNVKK